MGAWLSAQDAVDGKSIPSITLARLAVTETSADNTQNALGAIKQQLDATEGGSVVRESIKRHYEISSGLPQGFASLA